MKTIAWCTLALLIPLGTSGCSSATTADGGTDAAVVDSSSLDASPADASPPTDASTHDASASLDGGSDAAMSTVTVTVTNFAVFGDCMPIVAPDPIHASWTATVDGAMGTTAMLTNALLVIRPSTTGSDVMQNLTVDAPSISLSAGHGSAMQTKTAADMDPPAGCSGICGGAAHLILTFMIDGAPVQAFGDATVSCAF